MNTNRHAESENATNTLLRMQTARKVNVSAVLLTAVAFFLLVAAVGGYFFNWTWTGFQGNTLWDWLKLLFLPIVLATAKLSFKEHQRTWFIMALLASFVLFIGALGGYFFHWTWTGFQGNTLWDWLVLLAIPIAFVAVNLTYAEYQREKKAFEEKQRERETSLQA